jgi:hypothetical protein
MSKMTFEDKWQQMAEAAKNQAQKLPHGKDREALERKARQLKTAAELNQWLTSNELKPPK